MKTQIPVRKVGLPPAAACHIEEMWQSLDDPFSGCNDKLRIIANILQYLDAEELREARVVSRKFNEVICGHPMLLWDKNALLIDIDEEDAGGEEKKWIEVRLHRLITEYGCPNFHFHMMNLLSLKPVEFFQSSVRYQIRELKLTSCTFSTDLLRHILACTTRNLEYLEIDDFSNFRLKSKSFTEVLKQADPFLQNLTSVILRSQSKLDIYNNRECIELPNNLLHCIFNGVQNLQRITLEGWNSKTCGNLLRIIRQMPPENAEKIQSLEMLCILEKELSAVEQFSFLKTLELIQLPFLRNFKIRFSRSPMTIQDLTIPVRQDLTCSLATFLQNNCLNLEVLDLINCPVHNAILKPNISSFPSLYHVNTKGTFISELDGDANDDLRLTEFPLRMLRSSMKKVQNFPAPAPSIQPSTQQQQRANSSTQPSLSSFSYSRMEVYQLCCLFVISVVGIHLLLKWMFPMHPYIADQLEVLLFVTIIFCLTQRNEISLLWTSTSEEESEYEE